jgi:hypothetical protein
MDRVTGQGMSFPGPTHRRSAELDATLHDFVGVPDYIGSAYRVDELRSDLDRFARMLGYDWPAGDAVRPPQ